MRNKPARAAALKALALDDRLSEAHAVLGFCKSVYEWDQSGAERELRRAVELNPGYAFAHIWRGEVLSDMGRPKEALAELDRARELGPTSLMVSDQRGWALYMAPKVRRGDRPDSQDHRARAALCSRSLLARQGVFAKGDVAGRISGV